jgi:membrane protease YdiL (CAAX protease family)
MAAGLGLGLLLMGALRYSSHTSTVLTPMAPFATPGYIAVTAVFTVLLNRARLPLNRFGFGARPGLQHVALAVAAVALLQSIDFTLSPLIEQWTGETRNLERFSGVRGSLTALTALLVANWTFAAFGEEFAYRIVLMRGLAFAFGDTRTARVLALLLQAVIFGAVHAYQGPAGIVGATISGLVFGAVTLAGRWSIWPAAIAHGTNNTFGIVALYMGAA